VNPSAAPAPASVPTPEPASRGPYTIGLTGGIGSGKSTAAAGFEGHGIAVVDADAIARELTMPGGGAMAAIRAAFGAAFITADGAMDRARMREHVFEAPRELARLEAILHPLIRAQTERARRASAGHSPYVILMIPLLVEAARRDSGWRARFDRVAVVDCSEATQVRRVMARSGLTAEAVRRIQDAQASRAERLAAADDVIDNDGSQEALAPQVARLHQMYLRLAAAPA
jgi:dephospho-CoA kinase